MRTDNRARHIDAQIMPTSSTAVQMYVQNGGRIGEVTEFGHDPIKGNASKCAMRMHSLKSVNLLSIFS